MGQKSYSYFHRMVFMISDFFIVNSSYLIANSFFALSKSSLLSQDGFRLLVLFNVSWLVSGIVMRLYSGETFQGLEELYRQSAKTILLQSISFAVIMYFLGTAVHEKRFFIICYGSLVTLVGISRFIFTYTSEFITKAKLHKKIAIVGYNETGVELAKYFEGNNNIYSFEGFFDNGSEFYSVNEEGRIVGPIEQCIHFAIENNIKEIYSTILPEQHDEVTKLVEFADRNCVRVKFVPNVKAALETTHPVQYLGDFPVISLRFEPLQELKNRIKKRLFDIFVSSFIILFILSWLMPLIAILIKLESKGPVFFKQLRSGRDNKPFWCYKFRSMKVNGHSDVLQASKSDQRITRIGAFLRKTSLDEFPQFFNVLMGDMSIVGPRPHMLKHTEKYSALINKYMVRQFLKPGVTGWAQVNGYRGETKNIELMEKRVEYDMWYMERWSTMLDIRIIFMTIINVFRGEEQAY